MEIGENRGRCAGFIKNEIHNFKKPDIYRAGTKVIENLKRE